MTKIYRNVHVVNHTRTVEDACPYDTLILKNYVKSVEVQDDLTKIIRLQEKIEFCHRQNSFHNYSLFIIHYSLKTHLIVISVGGHCSIVAKSQGTKKEKNLKKGFTNGIECGIVIKNVGYHVRIQGLHGLRVRERNAFGFTGRLPSLPRKNNFILER